ncbi:hypothetical protein EI555_018277, partial [Monodon monoceros]
LGDFAPVPAWQPGCLHNPWAAVRATVTDYQEEQSNWRLWILSENPTNFTITVTSEAGENDETFQTILKSTKNWKRRRKETKEAEAEKELFEDTPVTIKNFLSWKAKFDAELLELFETDHNLDTCNIQFLEDAGYSVQVDESLVQEMNDLDLQDEVDDPDYNPADHRVT